MHRMRQFCRLHRLAFLALLLLMGQSSLLWHTHDSVAHEHKGACEVCTHSHSVTGPIAGPAPVATPVYRVERRLVDYDARSGSAAGFTAFQSRAPPLSLSS